MKVKSNVRAGKGSADDTASSSSSSKNSGGVNSNKPVRRCSGI